MKILSDYNDGRDSRASAWSADEDATRQCGDKPQEAFRIEKPRKNFFLKILLQLTYNVLSFSAV